MTKSKVSVPSAIAGLFTEAPQTEKQLLLDRYKDWQESLFAKAHYEYLVRKYNQELKKLMDVNLDTPFEIGKNHIEVKARLELLNDLKNTFKCETK